MYHKQPTKNTILLTLTKHLFHLLQCLHHISNFKQHGQYTKAFSNKVQHLNWFIKPACPDPQVKYEINEINKTWVSQISSALVSHYSASISALQNKILALNLSSNLIQEICENTIYRARRRYGKKISQTTLEQFRNILFLITKGQTTTLNTLPKPHSSKPNTNFKPKSPITPINHQHTPPNKTQTNKPVRLVKGYKDPLSNFYPCKFIYQGTTYKSVEHCYQSIKAQQHNRFGLAQQIAAQKRSVDAKRLGKFPTDDFWKKQKFSFVYTLLNQKWMVVPEFRQELSTLTNVEIVHPVHDPEWGTGIDGKGQDMFSALLTSLRNSKLKSVSKNQTTNPNHTHKQTSTTNNIPINNTLKNTPTKTQPTTLKNIPIYTKQHTPTPQPPTNKVTPPNTPKHHTTSKQKQYTPTPISTSNRFSLLIPLTTQPPPQKTNTPTKSQIKTSPVAPKTINTPPKSSLPSQPSLKTTNTSPNSLFSTSDFPPLSPPLSQPLPLTTSLTTLTPMSSSQPTSFPTTNKRKRIVFRSLPCPLYTPLTHSNKRSHSPNTSPSPKTSSPPTKQRKCAAPPKRSTSNIKPSYYKTAFKTSWRWPKSEKPVLVIGASNLNRITKSSSDQIEIHSYPGARFSNFTDMLKHLNVDTIHNHPKSIIVHMGINDRSANPEGTSIRNFKTMMGHIVSKFPHTSIYPVVINYSQKLPITNRMNLDKLNDAIRQYTNVHAIPKLQHSLFHTNEHDNIHWNEECANALLAHWLSELQSLN